MCIKSIPIPKTNSSFVLFSSSRAKIIVLGRKLLVDIEPQSTFGSNLIV